MRKIKLYTAVAAALAIFAGCSKTQEEPDVVTKPVVTVSASEDYTLTVAVKSDIDLASVKVVSSALGKETVLVEATSFSNPKDYTYTGKIEFPDGAQKVEITATAINTKNLQSGKSITVDAPAKAAETFTLADFAAASAELIKVWENTIGEARVMDGDVVAVSFTDVHIIPGDYLLDVKGNLFNKAQYYDIAARNLKRFVDGTVKMDDEIVLEHPDFQYAGNPYNETDANGGAFRQKDVDINFILNFTSREIGWVDNPATGNGTWSNMCGYNGASETRGTPQVTEYSGVCCMERGFIIIARFYKWLAENNVKDASALDGVRWSSDLYGVEPVDPDPDEPDPENPDEDVVLNCSIKEFAQEYVKLIDVWEKTVGTINYVTGETLEDIDGKEYDESLNNENAHYIPSTTTITVDGHKLLPGQVIDVAIRSYLLLRGYDGNQESGALGGFASVEPATMSGTTAPKAYGFVFGPSSFNEAGSTEAGNIVNGNGGHLRMGDPQTADGKASSVKMDILDNFAQRFVNWPFNHDGVHSNMCGYSGRLDGYYGCFCAQRALVTYAFFFKYMLDNNLDSAKDIAEDTIFRSELFGDE